MGTFAVVLHLRKTAPFYYAYYGFPFATIRYETNWLKIEGGTNICEEPVSNIVYTGVASAKLI